MWSYRQWHDPKGLEPGMLRIISPPFKRIKYHSSRGLRLVSLCVCVSVCLSVFVCVRFLCVCVCQGVVHLAHAVPDKATVSASAIARGHHPRCLPVFTSRPTPPLPPSSNRTPPASPPGHMGAVGGFTSHHFPWPTVGEDQGATRV